jgi:hypothetical protein
VPYPPRDTPQQCLDKWPEHCQLVDCTFSPPPSRLVAPVPGGGCRWISECNTSADCVLARDARQCCACFEAYPMQMIAADRCLAPIYMSAWPPPGCKDVATGCEAVRCAPCPDLPPPLCLPGSEDPALKVCAPGWEA